MFSAWNDWEFSAMCSEVSDVLGSMPTQCTFIVAISMSKFFPTSVLVTKSRVLSMSLATQLRLALLLNSEMLGFWYEQLIIDYLAHPALPMLGRKPRALFVPVRCALSPV